MGEVELLQHDAYALVVEDAIAVQSILLPLPLIGYLSTGVVEHSSALHPVFYPFTAVLSALVIVESSKTVTELPHLIPFIASLLQHLADIFWIVLISSFLGRNEIIFIFILLLPFGFRLLVSIVVLVEVVDVGIVARAFAENSFRVDDLMLLQSFFGLQGFTGDCVSSSLRVIHANRMLELVQDYVILLGDKRMA